MYGDALYVLWFVSFGFLALGIIGKIADWQYERSVNGRRKSRRVLRVDRVDRKAARKMPLPRGQAASAARHGKAA